MKAIIVSTLPCTATLDRRVKAKAEGVPAITRSIDDVENRHGILPTDEACRFMAEELCRTHGWSTDLAAGILPNGDHVFCFAPKVDESPTFGPSSKEIPPDPDGQNDMRAEWAEQALEAFIAVTRTDEEDAICDLLSDIRHLCDRAPARFGTFEDAMRRAVGHYTEETAADEY